MKILVTNDDGVFAPGLWQLVRELKEVATVIVSAPAQEQSATGTAVTLRSPLKVQEVAPLIPGVQAWAVDGTPADSVIVALGKLATGINLVVSGINNGSNLGEDVLISGTVGAALQGYLRGLHAIAVSIPREHTSFTDNAARVAAVLSRRILANHIPTNLFLNVNVPGLPLAEIKGVKIANLATKSHIDTVDEGPEGHHGYYRLVRKSLNNHIHHKSDIAAFEEGNITITPLAIILPNKPAPSLLNSLRHDLLSEIINTNSPNVC